MKKIQLGIISTFPQTDRSIKRLNHIPLRWARLLSAYVDITFIYTGSVKHSYLNQNYSTLYIEESNFIRKLPWFFRLYLLTWTALRKKRFDILMNLNSHINMWLVALAAGNVRTISRVTGLTFPQKPKNLRNQILKLFCISKELLSLRNTDHTLFICRHLKKKMEDRNCKAKNSYVISTGVDVDLFRFKEDEKIVEPVQKLLFVGRLDPIKQPFHAIEIFERLQDNYPYLELEMIGEGKLEQAIRHYISNNDKIILRGHVEHNKLPYFFFESSILILTSLTEGLPNCVLEAMASGVPVVSYNVGAISELLQSGRGAPISPGCVDDFLSAIKRLIDSDTLRLQVANNALKYINEFHSLESVRGRVLDILK